MCVVHKPAANAGPTTGERLVHETDIGAIRWLQQCSPHSAVRPKGWGKQRATGYGLNVLQTEKKIRSETMSKSGSYIGGHTVITVPRGPWRGVKRTGSVIASAAARQCSEGWANGSARVSAECWPQARGIAHECTARKARRKCAQCAHRQCRHQNCSRATIGLDTKLRLISLHAFDAQNFRHIAPLHRGTDGAICNEPL